MTLVEAAASLRSRKVSARELAFDALARIAARNADLNAFITVTEETARLAAAQADSDLEKGIDRGPLHGIPVAIKDLFHTRGVSTTAGSLVYKDFVPEANADLVDDLIRGGAVIVGKANMHELAYGVTSDNPHYGPVRNPHDPERVAGGSSGGSAAALADGMALFALGTDTGGSIRIPSSFCGTAGLKPTYGRLSRRGVIPLGFSLDHPGPMAATVRDLRFAWGTLDGAKRDQSNIDASNEMLDTSQIRGLRIGLPENFYFDRVQPEVAHGVRRALDVAAGLGARIVPLGVPDIDAINTLARVILLAEAAALHEGRIGKREMFGADVLALLEQGQFIRATDYINAQRARRACQRQFAAIWEQVDLLATPATPTTAPRIGQKNILIDGAEEDTRIASTRFVRGINLLGVPALAMPCGRDAGGLPIGLQLIAPPYREERLLSFGAVLEEAL